MSEYTPTKIWIKKREYTDGDMMDMKPKDWELSMKEPDYLEELYDEYIAIRIQNFAEKNDCCPKCTNGSLIAVPTGGVKCNSCDYRFCF